MSSGEFASPAVPEFKIPIEEHVIGAEFNNGQKIIMKHKRSLNMESIKPYIS